jgi:hypothetical protein
MTVSRSTFVRFGRRSVMRSSFMVALFAFALPLGVAHAEDRDVSAFGGDAYVRQGEIVRSVSAFGGDARVDGEVLGNVSAFGGDVLLGPTAIVHGSVDAAGGRVQMEAGARALGGTTSVAPEHDHGRHEHHGPAALVRGLVGSALLFLLALLLTGVVPERMSALHVAIIREPGRSVGAGMLGYAGAALLLIALMITVIGIPLALALAVFVPVATYVGLAAAVTVIGAALPFERLRGRPLLQILSGVGVLFVISQVPVLGSIAVAIIACLGVGALVRTRFRATPPAELNGDGPYRTSASA